jgi:S1-C subfamily serine protease
MDSSGIVIIVKTGGATPESVGTGFFVGKTGLLLTCYHVIRKSALHNASNRVEFMFEGKTQVFFARLGEFDPINDVAILYTDTMKPKGYYLSKSGKPQDKFDTLGFPEKSLVGVTEHPSYERKSPDGLIELKESNNICQGFSGAPLLDCDGLVSGIINVVPKTLRIGVCVVMGRKIHLDTLYFSK